MEACGEGGPVPGGQGGRSDATAQLAKHRADGRVSRLPARARALRPGRLLARPSVQPAAWSAERSLRLARPARQPSKPESQQPPALEPRARAATSSRGRARKSRLVRPARGVMSRPSVTRSVEAQRDSGGRRPRLSLHFRRGPRLASVLARRRFVNPRAARVTAAEHVRGFNHAASGD